MSKKEYGAFKSTVLHLKERRNHAIKSSLGVYDAYKYIRKNKWFDIGRPLTEHEFYSIVRNMNLLFAEELAKGEEIVFPCRMGKLELRKRNSVPTLDSKGKVKVTYTIDWDKTLRLWYEDEEEYNRKTLVRIPEKEIYKVYYNKAFANYANKGFMEFKVNRDIKKSLKHSIKNSKIDAFGL